MTSPFAFLDDITVDPKNELKRGIKILKQNDEMLKNGITEEQRKKAYYPRISEALYHNIDPYVYSGQEDSIKQAMHDVFFKLHIPDENKLVETNRRNIKEPLGFTQTSRLDAFRMYLGLPQKYGTFGVSSYKPINNEDDDATYYKIPKHEEILKDPHYFKLLVQKVEGAKAGKYDDRDTENKIINLPLFMRGVSKNKALISDFDPTTVLGDYKLDLGKDKEGNYLSYYDKWDLNPKVAKPSNIEMLAGLGVKMIGHPYEIYGRIYYDPKTYKPIK